MKELIQEAFTEGGWLKLNKTLGRTLGLEAAVILGNLIDKSSYFNSEVFFMVRDDIEFETTLTPYLQRKGEKKLVDNKLIVVKAGAHPTQMRRVNYYGLNFENIYRFLKTNKRTIADKKQEKKEFYSKCFQEVQALNESTTADEIRSLKELTTAVEPSSRQHAEGFDGNKNKEDKNKRNNSSTTNSFEVENTSTPVKGIRHYTITSEAKDIITAYKSAVDDSYLPAPKDYMSINDFIYPAELVEYMPYWIKYNGTHVDYLDRGNNVDSFDKKHSAQIHVIIKHWNNFKKFAQNKIKAEKQYAQAFGE